MLDTDFRSPRAAGVAGEGNAGHPGVKGELVISSPGAHLYTSVAALSRVDGRRKSAP